MILDAKKKTLVSETGHVLATLTDSGRPFAVYLICIRLFIPGQYLVPLRVIELQTATAVNSSSGKNRAMDAFATSQVFAR